LTSESDARPSITASVDDFDFAIEGEEA